MNPQKWIIKDLLAVTAEYLKKKDIDNPRLCTEILLAFQLKTTRIKLYLNFDQPVGEKDLNEFRILIQRRLNREPVQYITGVQEFWSKEFMVNPKVLIPRPETEVLVEQTLAVLGGKKEQEESRAPSILDIGTGSGAIAVSLAGELSDAEVWASDVSDDALETAKANAQRHGVEEKIKFVKSDLFSAIDPSIHFDVIVSNPPYVALEDLDNLQPEVGRYEPRSALDGGTGGLVIINKLILEAKKFLKPGGWLLMEMDPSQTAKAIEIIEKNGHFGEKKVIKDYSRCDRVVMTQLKKSIQG